LSASISFNAGIMDERSLEATVRVGDCVVHADSLLSFLDELKRSSPLEPVFVPILSELPNDLRETPVPLLSGNPISPNSPSTALETPIFSPLLSVPSISALASPASPLLKTISVSAVHRGSECKTLIPLLDVIAIIFAIPPPPIRCSMPKVKRFQVQCEYIL
jgi:hypothetical protein